MLTKEVLVKKCVVCQENLVQDRTMLGELSFGGPPNPYIRDGSHCPKCGIKYVTNCEDEK